MKLGLYRLNDPILGEAALVHKSAGDAAPYLSRYLYEHLKFEPAFDCLPMLVRIPTQKRASEAKLGKPGSPSAHCKAVDGIPSVRR
jgi:hypothetical protein